MTSDKHPRREDGLLCRMCAVGKVGRGEKLSDVVQSNGITERTSVEVVNESDRRGFHCPECGGLAGYAVTDSREVVSISAHPQDRW